MPYYQQTGKSLFPLMVWTTLIFEPIYTVNQIVNDHCARDYAPDISPQIIAIVLQNVG